MQCNKLKNKMDFECNLILYNRVGSTNKLKFDRHVNTYNFKIRYYK